MKTVSVVIPTYNRINFLLRAIDSILKQTYPIHQIIVVDNNSTDNTSEILRNKYTKIEILSEHKNIVGIKEAVCNEERIKDLIKISLSNDNFKIYSGDDPSFLNMLSVGGHGVISVAANVVPKYISDICSFYQNNEVEKAEKINDKLKNLYDLLFIESNPIPVKWMMYKMGLVQNALRLPLVELDRKYQEIIISEMLKLELL